MRVSRGKVMVAALKRPHSLPQSEKRRTHDPHGMIRIDAILFYGQFLCRPDYSHECTLCARNKRLWRDSPNGICDTCAWCSRTHWRCTMHVLVHASAQQQKPELASHVEHIASLYIGALRAHRSQRWECVWNYWNDVNMVCNMYSVAHFGSARNVRESILSVNMHCT